MALEVMFEKEFALKHAELDFRWVTDNEYDFLINYAVITKGTPRTFRVFLAAECHELMEIAYPRYVVVRLRQLLVRISVYILFCSVCTVSFLRLCLLEKLLDDMRKHC
jgi:hypothetical protein